MTETARPVRLIEHAWIPMRDGCRLAARIWLPDDAVGDPVPAILEYTPYRKSDATALADAPMHAYFAAHGYASVRVDLRGSGDSEGVLEDEYLALEQQDGLDVVRWLAAQDWCTGAVGMMGISWGGFNALQIAALAPAEVRAVISVASADDRYAHDVHYTGGCLLGWTMLSWASTMLAYNARPPHPEVVGDSWRNMWIERMERTPPYIERWLGHQRRDAYWKHGSVCEDYAAIRCAVYMVGGWSDPYRDAVLSFLEGYQGPCKGLIGPWAHRYPHDGVPGPAIGFLQEAVRWWDHWLKEIDNGIMEEPKLRLWIQSSVRPGEGYPERGGRWIAERRWPTTSVASRRLWLASDATLVATHEAGFHTEPMTIRGADSVVTDIGAWCSPGTSTDRPRDQRADDGMSLVFDSDPLQETVEIIGTPAVRVELSADRPQALLAARLCDVWPDGTSMLITRGLLNLTHRASHENPAALVPGQGYAVELQLGAIAQTVPPGHRLRLALAPAYWPWAWPSPEPVTLTVMTGRRSALELPVRVGGQEGQAPPHFALPESAPQPRHELSDRGSTGGRSIVRDIATGSVDVLNDWGLSPSVRLHETGIEYREWGIDRYHIVEDDPLSARTSSERHIEIRRAAWHTRISTKSTLSSTNDAFLISNGLDAYENERQVFTKEWHHSIPREDV